MVRNEEAEQLNRLVEAFRDYCKSVFPDSPHEDLVELMDSFRRYINLAMPARDKE